MLKLHNTLTRQTEPFKPLKAGQVSLYTCGPTVYGPAHIGNLRTYVWEDVLRRWLAHGHGLKVQQVMNITDVEDKILKSSKAKTVAEMQAFTKQFEDKFHADLAALRIEPAEQYPRATESIEAMIKLIEAILAAGYAYERDGSVYFDVRKYDADHGYGKLLNIDFAGFERHHRIDNDEYDKESVQDFALWKAAPTTEPGWDSPWGWGRPGWHVECSAMAKANLGETIDLHTGAVDNIFPHHENEIAQSQAANGKPLAKAWLHAEHLLADGQKMAKSAGNFYTLDDVTAKGFPPAVLRMLYLQAHYRSKLNFTWDSLAAARESYDRLQDFLLRLSDEQPGGTDQPAEVTELLATAQAKFIAAMDDDLGTPEALAVVFELVRELNSLLDAGRLDEGEVVAVKDAFDRFDQVLGVVSLDPIEVSAEVEALVERREAARAAKDFAASDKLRKEIERAGFAVEDTERGPRLRKISQ